MASALECVHCENGVLDEESGTPRCVHCKGHGRFARCSCCGDVIDIDEAERNEGSCLRCRIDAETSTLELDPPSVSFIH